MKVSVCILMVLAMVLAEPPVPSSQYLPANGGPSPGYGVPPLGGGNGPSPRYGPPQPRPQYGAPGGGDEGGAPASYQFEYSVQDAESENDFGHQEMREGDVAQGKYYVLLPDGRKQIVEYTADNEGYKPMVTYEGGANGGGYPRRNGGGGNGGYNY